MRGEMRGKHGGQWTGGVSELREEEEEGRQCKGCRSEDQASDVYVYGFNNGVWTLI